MLKSRSDEAPVRRRSLVERTGMKNLMQVSSLVFTMISFMMMMTISKMFMVSR